MRKNRKISVHFSDAGINDVPDDVLLKILGFLSPFHLKKLSLVSWRFAEIVSKEVSLARHVPVTISHCWITESHEPFCVFEKSQRRRQFSAVKFGNAVESADDISKRAFLEIIGRNCRVLELERPMLHITKELQLFPQLQELTFSFGDFVKARWLPPTLVKIVLHEIPAHFTAEVYAKLSVLNQNPNLQIVTDKICLNHQKYWLPTAKIFRFVRIDPILKTALRFLKIEHTFFVKCFNLRNYLSPIKLSDVVCFGKTFSIFEFQEAVEMFPMFNLKELRLKITGWHCVCAEYGYSSDEMSLSEGEIVNDNKKYECFRCLQTIFHLLPKLDGLAIEETPYLSGIDILLDMELTLRKFIIYGSLDGILEPSPTFANLKTLHLPQVFDIAINGWPVMPHLENLLLNLDNGASVKRLILRSPNVRHAAFVFTSIGLAKAALCKWPHLQSLKLQTLNKSALIEEVMANMKFATNLRKLELRGIEQCIKLSDTQRDDIFNYIPTLRWLNGITFYAYCSRTFPKPGNLSEPEVECIFID